jgi:adenine/guanine phosphoribosyltransferase-like PRPP-binding protein
MENVNPASEDELNAWYENRWDQLKDNTRVFKVIPLTKEQIEAFIESFADETV